jgi:hypothetical protein
MHIGALGELKLPRVRSKSGMFTDEEKDRTLNFAEALVRAQPWRAHDGSLARVVAFLSDGAHVVFFECTFRVEVRELALHADLHAARESGPLPLRGAGGDFLAGLTVAPLAALGCELPNCMVDGSAVTLQAYLGAGATSTGFAGTWRGDAVVIKMYHVSAAPEVAALELTALLAAADVPGVCQLRGAGDGFLLLAPRGAVAYSLRADPAAAPRARATPSGLWSPARAAAEPPALLAVASDPARPGAAEFCDLVDALAGLHAAGWVHRDPRPANFFRDAAGRFFLADLGSAARVGDAAAATDGRPWALQYGPLAALHAAAGGAPLPAPEPAHDFEQVARLVYATQAHDGDTLPVLDGACELCDWWALRDGSLTLRPLLAAAAAAAAHPAAGGAQRDAFKALIRLALVR